MDKRNKKKGFTLIELIVVMAIIVILAGIGVPQVMKAITKSKITADVATARNIAGAMQQYLAEGNTLEDATLQEVVTTGNNLKPFDLSKYIDNASESIKSKVNPNNYRFYYTYNSANNTIEIYAGSGTTTTTSTQSGQTQTKNCYKLYPTVDPDYK